MHLSNFCSIKHDMQPLDGTSAQVLRVLHDYCTSCPARNLGWKLSLLPWDCLPRTATIPFSLAWLLDAQRTKCFSSNVTSDALITIGMLVYTQSIRLLSGTCITVGLPYA
eukprot:GHUV01042609.1.p1 GENE.GHUV01042609.1~~GHUV01042609.1.p1  ORF type:complete len:110 (+),score=0.14 GHUV01042609.1:399-728(+)